MKFTYNYLWRQLAQVYDTNEAKSIIKLVLEKQFGLTPTDVYCGKVESLSEDEDAVLEMILIRLKNSEPVQYVLGMAEFCGRDFVVHPGVLIPRPETAELVSYMIKDMAGNEESNRDMNILDIGTGSGCIAVSLSLAIKGAHITAWDVSDVAIKIAEENSKRFGADVEVHCMDALNPPPDNDRWNVIVSNPPYIRDMEKPEMDRNVLDFEPEMALFVPDDDPLLFYRAIADYGKIALKHGGRLYFEVNPVYVSETMKMLSEKEFKNVVSVDDDFGKQRFVKCIR
jgi:release factor glutamine methyltransferase